ncbi:MAG: UDP-glucose/GDP-mannose dehydrogenase family protein [Bauldia sp.]|nr:UDP-glucose/GDP-mannose dehydrogenase family protein [Bauldia sp.]MCW5719234.1 UDP-glucose/GDP-mannose dehydrogenase family protein [Bauldia sp.]
MRLTVIGTGYVGLVSGACFAEVGHTVTCMDIDAGKIGRLDVGEIPIFEPGLEEIVRRNRTSGRLRFACTVESVADADAVFLAVGTPTRVEDGEADLNYLFAAVEMMAPHLDGRAVIVSKSTVPVGTGDRIAALLASLRPGIPIDVASCPEFLREGSAVVDFMEPSRIVIGAESVRAIGVLRDVYRPFTERGCPLRAMSRRSAELAKYAANAFLATKVTFINEIADFCERVGADVHDVASSMGLDPRIGPSFLNPGPGYGGSCFPKDTLALLRHGESFDTSLQIVETVVAVNERRKRQLCRRVLTACGGSVAGKRIALLGVAFKPDTDDMRDAPSIHLARRLVDEGATLVAYDPAARANAEVLPAFRSVDWAGTALDAVEDADAVAIMTEWNEFREIDLAELHDLMRTPIVVDFRNVFSPSAAEAAGLVYWQVGRPVVGMTASTGPQRASWVRTGEAVF